MVSAITLGESEIYHSRWEKNPRQLEKKMSENGKKVNLSGIINSTETRLVVRARYFGEKIAPTCTTYLPVYEIQLLAQTSIEVEKKEHKLLAHLVYTNIMSYKHKDLWALYPFDGAGVAYSVYSEPQIDQQFDVIFKSWENRSADLLRADPWLTNAETCFFKSTAYYENREDGRCADQQLLQQLSRISMWLDCKIADPSRMTPFEARGINLLSFRLSSFISDRNREWVDVKQSAETLVELLSLM